VYKFKKHLGSWNSCQYKEPIQTKSLTFLYTIHFITLHFHVSLYPYPAWYLSFHVPLVLKYNISFSCLYSFIGKDKLVVSSCPCVCCVLIYSIWYGNRY
jgi:hypothetical protein